MSRPRQLCCRRHRGRYSVGSVASTNSTSTPSWSRNSVSNIRRVPATGHKRNDGSPGSTSESTAVATAAVPERTPRPARPPSSAASSVFQRVPRRIRQPRVEVLARVGVERLQVRVGVDARHRVGRREVDRNDDVLALTSSQYRLRLCRGVDVESYAPVCWLALIPLQSLLICRR